jgi:hypothetical protein
LVAVPPGSKPGGITASYQSVTLPIVLKMVCCKTGQISTGSVFRATGGRLPQAVVRPSGLNLPSRVKPPSISRTTTGWFIGGSRQNAQADM